MTASVSQTLKALTVAVLCMACAACSQPPGAFTGNYSAAPAQPAGVDSNLFTRMNDG